MPEIELIDISEIEKLSKALQLIDKDWAKNLSALIEKKENVEFTATKVYNVVNSRTKHQTHRMRFMKWGKQLLLTKSAELAKAKEAITA